MTDDWLKKRHQLDADFRRKAAWLVERSAHTDHNGRIDHEIDAELARRYGVADDRPARAPDLDSQLAEIRLARSAGDTARAAELQTKLLERVTEGLGEPVTTVPPADGGPRQTPPGPDGLKLQIREAEQRGDLDEALRLKSQQLTELPKPD